MSPDVGATSPASPGTAAERAARCAWFLTDLSGGGAERLPLLLGPALRRTRLTLTILKGRADHELPGRGMSIAALAGPEARLSRNAPRLLAGAVRAARAADVVVGGLEWAPTLFAAGAAAIARRPLVSIVHAPLELYDRFERLSAPYRGAYRAALAASRVVVAVSDDVAATLPAHGARPARVRVIPNPVPAPPAGAFPRAFPEGGAPWRIISMGRLHAVKGYDVALAAAARLRELPWTWTFHGEGPERTALESRARALGLADRVRFPGFAASPAGCFAHADLFVLSSRIEGFSLALVEAMRSGLPIVATRCGRAIESKLAHGRAGMLVPLDDPGALADALVGLMRAPSRAAALGREARELGQAFDPAVVAPAWDDLLAGLAVRERGRP